MALPRAILFDLDETLLSFGHRPALLADVVQAFAVLFEPVAPARAAELLEAQFNIFWSDAERHRLWRTRPLIEARRYICAKAFEDLAAEGARGLTEALAHDFAERFHAHRESQQRLFDGAHETLDALTAAGVRLALVTNGTGEAQRDKIGRFDLEHRFAHIQIEGEHGFGKPEARAYEHALQVLDLRPHETWMVGDNLDWEVAGPQKLGIFGIWHDPYGVGLPSDSPVRPDRIIRALPELLEPQW